jgi:hypothetical protein
MRNYRERRLEGEKIGRAKEDGRPRLNPLRSSSAKNLTGQAEVRKQKTDDRIRD